jgi:hypothetical protein
MIMAPKLHCAAGLSAVGIIMAFKNLKAMAVRGPRGWSHQGSKKVYAGDLCTEEAVNRHGIPDRACQSIVHRY